MRLLERIVTLSDTCMAPYYGMNPMLKRSDMTRDSKGITQFSHSLAIAMMFVCLSGTGVHCDHTVHFSADLSLWLDSPLFWAP